MIFFDKVLQFFITADIHIAVFGDTGSGKTILLSAFYGHQNSDTFESKSRYKLLATTAQSNRLLNNYYELEKNILPEQTNKDYEEFKFQVNVKGLNKTGANITWYDYPGEWWSNDPATKEEEKRRKELFEKLNNCDVALLLIDGAHLRNKEDKKKYIGKLFRQFTNEIERQFLEKEGENIDKQGVKLPKTWIICLTKSDLLDNYTCEEFKKDIHLCDETDNLRKALQERSSDKSEISLGNHFLKLSSAKIDVDKGLVTSFGNPIGIDLIPPIAVKTPLEYVRRNHTITTGFFGYTRLIIDYLGPLSSNYLSWFSIGVPIPLLDRFLSASSNKLQKQLDESLKNKNAVDFVVKAFMRKLSEAEELSDVYLSLGKDL